jgi:aryl-alcohol dehydrogenase-like predicted oxidoreductase
MKRRPLGGTGIEVGEVGLGCWQLGNALWDMHDDAEALRVVETAIGGGCDFFDTAPGYADGRSEELLGRAVKGKRDRVTICTKFGHGGDKPDFSAKALRPALEESFRRLQTGHVDLCLLHNPPVEVIDGTDLSVYEELEHLKGEGKLRAYGVSLDSQRELDLVLKHTPSQVVEILFHVFHQDPLAAFSRAQAKGVGIVVKVPLDSGWLSGKYRNGSAFTGIRGRWSPEIVARRAAMVEKFAALAPPGLSLTHVALAYLLAQPEVSTLIPGAKSAAQAADNLAASDVTLSPEVIRSLHSLWERELKDDPLPW